jgi:hypothetical protein
MVGSWLLPAAPSLDLSGSAAQHSGVPPAVKHQPTDIPQDYPQPSRCGAEFYMLHLQKFRLCSRLMLFKASIGSAALPLVAGKKPHYGRNTSGILLRFGSKQPKNGPIWVFFPSKPSTLLFRTEMYSEMEEFTVQNLSGTC